MIYPISIVHSTFLPRHRILSLHCLYQRSIVELIEILVNGTPFSEDPYHNSSPFACLAWHRANRLANRLCIQSVIKGIHRSVLYWMHEMCTDRRERRYELFQTLRRLLCQECQLRDLKRDWLRDWSHCACARIWGWQYIVGCPLSCDVLFCFLSEVPVTNWAVQEL